MLNRERPRKKDLQKWLIITIIILAITVLAYTFALGSILASDLDKIQSTLNIIMKQNNSGINYVKNLLIYKEEIFTGSYMLFSQITASISEEISEEKTKDEDRS